MNIVLTGGTGLIGTRLAHTLVSNHHDVSVLTRSPQSSHRVPDPVRLVGWDAKTVSDWADVIDGADAVINLAGENLAGKGFLPSPWTEERRERILQSRLRVGELLVDAIRDADQKPALIIQASAIGYYGTDLNEIMTEDHPPGSDFLAKVCLSWEASTEAVEEYGVRQIITRFGMVLTPQGGALPRLLLPFRFYLGSYFGTGRQWYSWIHLDDLCDAIHFLIHNPAQENVYNLTAPHPVRNRQFSKIIGKVLSRPSFIRVPGFVLNWAFGDVASVVLEGQHVLPGHLLECDFTFQFPRLEGALRDLLNR